MKISFLCVDVRSLQEGPQPLFVFFSTHFQVACVHVRDAGFGPVVFILEAAGVTGINAVFTVIFSASCFPTSHTAAQDIFLSDR